MKQSESIKVLFPVWELEPFIKVGGLGVVARSLPNALKKSGVDIRVVIPYYKAIKMHHQRKRKVGVMMVPYAGKQIRVEVWTISFLNAEIPVYLLQNKHYFDKPMPETFALFCGAVTQLVESKILSPWLAQIVHCNDNHCGLIPLLFKERGIKTKTLLTIHCLSHQRLSPPQYATNLGIPKDKLHLSRWEVKAKSLNFMAEGIRHADMVSTVSPTYLKEIQTEELGAGLDDLVRANMGKTTAILNGIDYTLHNPATNVGLVRQYSADHDPFVAKKANKAALQAKLGLPVQQDVSVIGFVGRLDVRQKGIEILHRMISREQFEKCQFVIMGHGEESWEERFTTLATFMSDRVVVVTKYDDELASLIYAGGDFVLIPSHFEPCCLIQMYAMRYGAIPIARATGGLSDTIRDGVNGLLYTSPTARELKATISRALEIKKNHPKVYRQMVISAMETNFSWDKSAKEYIKLYRKMLVE